MVINAGSRLSLGFVCGVGMVIIYCVVEGYVSNPSSWSCGLSFALTVGFPHCGVCRPSYATTHRWGDTTSGTRLADSFGGVFCGVFHFLGLVVIEVLFQLSQKVQDTHSFQDEKG